MAITRLNSLAIPAGTIVESDLSYPLTNFSSTGIDDNATSTAITIDASERVGIGTASPSYLVDARTASGNAQIYLRSGGDLAQLLLISNDTTGTSQINFGDADANNVGIISYSHNQNALKFTSNSAERMRIDSSGNVGIGTTSPSAELHIINTTPKILLQSSGAGTDNALSFISRNISNVAAYADIIGLGAGHNSTNAPILFTQGSGQTERMRIDSSGNLLVNTTSGNASSRMVVSDADVQMQLKATSNSGFIDFDGTNLQFSTNRDLKTGAFSDATKSNAAFFMSGGTGGSTISFYTASSVNTTGSERMRITSAGDVIISGTAKLASSLLTVDGNGEVTNGVCARVNNNAYWNYVGINSAGNNSFYVYGDGDVENTNNSYGAISDERVKSNIVDASSQIDDIMAVQVRSYTLNETGATHIGVVAQELEASGMSGLVKTKDDGMKSVKYSILYMKAIKALQEAVTRIETLEAEVAALKGA